MSLEMIHRNYEGIEILDLKGHLTFGQEDLDLRNELELLLKAQKTRVALNLSDLHELDTTGLATLLFARTKLREAGGELAIYNMHPSHIGLLVGAELETELKVFPAEQDAIDSFFPQRKLKPYDLLSFVQTPETITAQGGQKLC